MAKSPNFTNVPPADEQPTNVELMRRIQRGDVEAEGELWGKYRNGIRFLLLRKLSGRRQVAEDIEQEVFLALQKALRGGELSDPGRLGAYLHRVSLNLVARWWRGERRTGPLEGVDEPRTDETPESIEIDRETVGWLRRALQIMRPADRRILALRYGQEWSYARIGEVLDLKEEAARKRASRAIARLEAVLRRG
jgi:RNA polymerase sigma factor (sigma-70 family)